MIRFSNALKGLPVVGAGGMVLGDVVDLEVDEKTWKVENLAVRLRPSVFKTLRIKKPLWKRPLVGIPSRDVTGVSEVVVLKASLQDLAGSFRKEPPPSEAAKPEPPSEEAA